MFMNMLFQKLVEPRPTTPAPGAEDFRVREDEQELNHEEQVFNAEGAGIAEDGSTTKATEGTEGTVFDGPPRAAVRGAGARETRRS
jgi:hypothetical protein